MADGRQRVSKELKRDQQVRREVLDDIGSEVGRVGTTPQYRNPNRDQARGDPLDSRSHDIGQAEQVIVVTGSVDRHQLYAMQTPQVFERALIEEAYRAADTENLSLTDEVSAVERLRRKVALVLNDDFNFKITYPRDLPLAEFVLNQRARAGWKW